MREVNILESYFQTLDFEVAIKEIGHDDAKPQVLINGEAVYIETKAEVRPDQASNLLRNDICEAPLLVAAKYITPAAKEILKNHGINYLDSFGNAWINLVNLKIYVEKGDSKPVYNDYSNIFTTTGGKILFHLLNDDEKINDNYRHLAKISGVSLGSVSKFMQGLLNEGFAIRQNSKKMQLIRREELLERWIILLNEKILPAQKIGNFSFSKSDGQSWRNTDLGYVSKWSGEPAAAIMTDYLNPEKFSIFSRASKTELLTRLRLLPNNNGEVAVYTPFWEGYDYDLNERRYVDPLIVYAELVYSGNSRNREAADRVYRDFIQNRKHGF